MLMTLPMLCLYIMYLPRFCLHHFSSISLSHTHTINNQISFLKGRHYNYWICIIPNSQLVAIPYHPNLPETYVLPLLSSAERVNVLTVWSFSQVAIGIVHKPFDSDTVGHHCSCYLACAVGTHYFCFGMARKGSTNLLLLLLSLTLRQPQLIVSLFCVCVFKTNKQRNKMRCSRRRMREYFPFLLFRKSHRLRPPPLYIQTTLLFAQRCKKTTEEKDRPLKNKTKPGTFKETIYLIFFIKCWGKQS